MEDKKADRNADKIAEKMPTSKQTKELTIKLSSMTTRTPSFGGEADRKDL